jgi:hypothetical protein
MRIKLPAEVADLIRNLHPQIKRKIRSALEAIQEDPMSGKQLRGELAARQQGIHEARARPLEHFTDLISVRHGLCSLIRAGELIMDPQITARGRIRGLRLSLRPEIELAPAPGERNC